MSVCPRSGPEKGRFPWENEVFRAITNHGQRPWYWEGPPEGAVYVRLPPLGAWSWSGPGFLPSTGRGFSNDDDLQAYPLSCKNLPKP